MNGQPFENLCPLVNLYSMKGLNQHVSSCLDDYMAFPGTLTSI
jgi:hypothetical protein